MDHVPPDDIGTEILPEQELSASRLLRDTQEVSDIYARHLPEVLDSVQAAVAASDRTAEIERVVLSGSGDLHHAALGAQFAIEALAGLPTIVLPSMSMGLYLSPSLGRETLVVQMSYSGQTARAVEAARLASQFGARVWALTQDAQSPLGAAAELTLRKPDTGSNEAAGYPITLAMLFALGGELGAIRKAIHRSDRARLHEQLRSAVWDMQGTVQKCDAPSRNLAEQHCESPFFLFLGSGPNYGTAVNSSARILEATGANAGARDIEEWVHLERWSRDRDSPVVIACPSGPGMDRTREVLQALDVLQRPSILVTHEGARGPADFASATMPVVCQLPETLSPLVFGIPAELLAGYSSSLSGFAPYRGGDTRLQQVGEMRWGGTLRDRMDPVASPGSL